MTCKTTWFRGALAPGAPISNLRQQWEVPMTRKKSLAKSVLGSLAIAAGLLFPTDADAVQEVVDFRAVGEQNGPALRVGSLTVRGRGEGGSSNILTFPGIGLGIAGSGSFGIDDSPQETVIFTFASPASNVSLNPECTDAG